MLARLMRGIGANAFGQVVVAGLQLSLVPVFASHWGLDRYGVWILLSTIPSYLALGDFGFATAAGNDMTMKVARGDKAGAITTFQSAFAAVVVGSSGIGLLALTICALLPPNVLTISAPIAPQEIRATLGLLSIYGVICLLGSIVMAGFKCAGLYATGTLSQALLQLTEGTVAILTVCLGGSLWNVACAYLLCRLVGIGMQAFWLSRSVPWLDIGFKRAQFTEVKRLSQPAVAVMALPLAQATFLQGTAIVLGAATSAPTVAIFTTVRTLIRTGVQLTTLVNHAIMPEFSAAVARNDTQLQARILRFTLWLSVAILVPSAVVLLIWGRDIVAIWTRGLIHPAEIFIGIMTAVMLLNATWHPVSNLILAANRHASYSYLYLFAAILSVIICYPLARWFGTVGAGLSLTLLDAFMFFHIMRLATVFMVRSVDQARSDQMVHSTIYDQLTIIGKRLFHRNRRMNLRKP